MCGWDKLFAESIGTVGPHNNPVSLSDPERSEGLYRSAGLERVNALNGWALLGFPAWGTPIDPPLSNTQTI